jgi:RHS repeat-associated protein
MDAYTQLPSTSTRLSEVKYNTAGVVTDSKEYDYGVAMGAAPGNTKLIRETAIAYASLSNGIVDRPSSVTVKDWTTGTATTIASTTYIYDGGAVTGTTGTPQQVAIVGSRGNPTKITTSTSGTASLVKMLSYYDTGNLNVATDVNGALTTYVYGTLAATCGNSFPTTIDEPLSLSRSMTWDCTGGMATQTSDENGNTQQTNYTDPNFWRAANVFDQENNETTLSYFGRSAVESGAVNFNGGNSAADSRTTVDGFGRPIFTQRKQGPSATNYDTAEIDYNNLGQPNRSTMTYSAVASPSSPNTTAPATTTTYDALGRVLTVTDANNGKVTYTYTNNDVLQKVTGTQAFQKQLEYDGLGRLTSVCEISSTLSGVGTCLQGTSQTGYWTKYTYDALGRLLSVTQNAQAAMGSRQARSFVYDMVGRLRSESNPEAGNGVTNGTATYTYDVACATTPASPGDLTGKLDAAGNTTCYYYDSLHRLNGGGNTSVCRRFNYDNSVTPPAGVTVANTKTRLIEASTDNCGSTKFTDEWFSYSARGELSDVYESTPHSGSIPYHTTATYWPTGTLKSLGGIPSVPTIFYGASTGAGLDGEGRVTEVSASSGTNPVTNVTYSTSSTTNPLGALTGVTFGSADSDSFTYDPNTGRMATYRFSVNSHDDQGTLTWNTNGTLQKLVVNDVIPSTGDSETCNYLYDDLQRLSSSNCGALWSQTFTYDPFGNIKKSGSGGFNPLYSTTQNQFTSIPGITGPYYDMNGNLTKDNLNTYTWDPNWGNMLTVNTGSATVTATYDALGRMVENNAGGTFTQLIYGPTGAKLATANGSTLVKAFIALPGGAKAIYNSSGVLSYYRHSDWLGSSRLTSTQARALYSSSSYAPFGEQFALSGTTDASFTGQDQDTVSSLYDFPARRYSSSQGRWISPDPAGVAAVAPSNPQSWNRYTNVGNNPLNSIDPSGLFRLPCFTQGCIDGNGGAGGGSSDCEMDGVDVPCSVVDSVVEGGGATQCPDNDCSPVYANGSWMYFGAWADGSSGYLPIDFGGYSSADIAALRLVPNSDCSGPGSRRIDYEVKGAGSSGWFVTEQQVFPNGANYSDSSTFGGQFDDTIYGTYNGNSLQTFTVSRQDPTKGSGGASIGITVQLTIEPAQTKDFGTLGMWHGGLVGLTFIQGNSSGWAPCSGSYSRN